MQNIIEFIKYTILAIAVLIAFGLGWVYPMLTETTPKAWPWAIGAGMIVGLAAIRWLIWPILTPILRQTNGALRQLLNGVLFMFALITRPLR